MSTKQEVINDPQVSSTAQIQDLLKQFVELSGLAYADDDGYVRIRAEEGEDQYIELPVGPNKDPKHLVLYADSIKNPREVVVLNPFTESTTLTPDREWFFGSLLNNTLSLNSMWLFRVLLSTALERKPKGKETTKKGGKSKGKTAKAAAPVSESIEDIQLISPILNLVTDAKMLEEFDSVSSNIKDGEFLNIYYNRREMTVRMHCALLNPDIEKAYPSVRKTTWTNWRKIIEVVYGDLGKNYTIRAEIIGCPQLDATLKCWHTLFTKTGEYYKLVGIDVDLDRLKFHIDNLQIYHSKAKWLTQLAISSKAPAMAEPKPSIVGRPSTTQAVQPAVVNPQPQPVTVVGKPVQQYQQQPQQQFSPQPLSLYPSTMQSPYGGGGYQPPQLRPVTVNPQPHYGGGIRVNRY